VVNLNVESPHPLRTRVTLTVDDPNFRIREMTHRLVPEQRTPGSFDSLYPEAWGKKRAQDCPHQSETSGESGQTCGSIGRITVKHRYRRLVSNLAYEFAPGRNSLTIISNVATYGNRFRQIRKFSSQMYGI
jgi:hypothetical protein